ncbi:MAG: STAS domain-containing protein [Actinomycetota bacterium]
MTQAAQETEVREAAPRTIVVDIRGEITSGSEEVLMGAYNQASESGATTIILNFEGLEYMNSGGIGLLVTLLVRANRQRQALFAFGLSDHYRQIFELTRLDEAVGIFENEGDALRAAQE